MSDDIDKLLKDLGASSRERSSGLSSAPRADCLDEPTFEALMSAEMPAERRLEAEHHLAGCMRCTRVFALMAAESRPLADVRRDAVLQLAKSQLQPVQERAMVVAPPVRKSTPLLSRIQAWLGGSQNRQVGIAVGLAAAVALLVLVPRAGHTPGGGTELASNYSVSLSGGQQVYQGADPSTSSQSGPVVFGPDSRVKAVLAPAGAKSDATPGSASSPAAQEALVLVVRADGSIFQAAPGGAARVASGPGGILVQGDGAALFGEAPGPVQLWFVVAPQGQLPGPEVLAGSAPQVRERLEAGARKRKWWLDVRNATFAK